MAEVATYPLGVVVLVGVIALAVGILIGTLVRVLVADGGGRVSSARRPVQGAENAARFLLGLAAKFTDAVIRPIETTDGLGFEVRQEGAVTGILTLSVHDGLITDIRMMRNPDKLTLWA